MLDLSNYDERLEGPSGNREILQPKCGWLKGWISANITETSFYWLKSENWSLSRSDPTRRLLILQFGLGELLLYPLHHLWLQEHIQGRHGQGLGRPQGEELRFVVACGNNGHKRVRGSQRDCVSEHWGSLNASAVIFLMNQPEEDAARTNLPLILQLFWSLGGEPTLIFTAVLTGKSNIWSIDHIDKYKLYSVPSFAG